VSFNIKNRIVLILISAQPKPFQCPIQENVLISKFHFLAKIEILTKSQGFSLFLIKKFSQDFSKLGPEILSINIILTLRLSHLKNFHQSNFVWEKITVKPLDFGATSKIFQRPKCTII